MTNAGFSRRVSRLSLLFSLSRLGTVHTHVDASLALLPHLPHHSLDLLTHCANMSYISNYKPSHLETPRLDLQSHPPTMWGSRHLYCGATRPSRGSHKSWVRLRRRWQGMSCLLSSSRPVVWARCCVSRATARWRCARTYGRQPVRRAGEGR